MRLQRVGSIVRSMQTKELSAIRSERERTAMGRYRDKQLTPSPYLTIDEAAIYLRYNSTSGLRMAIRRGWLKPAGQRGPGGCLLFRKEDLDRFVLERPEITNGHQM